MESWVYRATKAKIVNRAGISQKKALLLQYLLPRFGELHTLKEKSSVAEIHTSHSLPPPSTSHPPSPIPHPSPPLYRPSPQPYPPPPAPTPLPPFVNRTSPHRQRHPKEPPLPILMPFHQTPTISISLKEPLTPSPTPHSPLLAHSGLCPHSPVLASRLRPSSSSLVLSIRGRPSTTSCGLACSMLWRSGVDAVGEGGGGEKVLGVGGEG